MSSVTWEDLQCGEAINVYGRHLLLMACDSSTKDWYARRGIKQRTLTVSQGEVEVRKEKKSTLTVAAPLPGSICCVQCCCVLLSQAWEHGEQDARLDAKHGRECCTLFTRLKINTMRSFPPLFFSFKWILETPRFKES